MVTVNRLSIQIFMNCSVRQFHFVCMTEKGWDLQRQQLLNKERKFFRKHNSMVAFDRFAPETGRIKNSCRNQDIYFSRRYLNKLGYFIKMIKNGRKSLRLRKGEYWRKLSRCRSDHVPLWFLFPEKFFSINFIFLQVVLSSDF